MSVLLFFVDGLGIGARGADNPLDGLDEALPLAVFQGEDPQTIFDGKVVITDACLGVSGRPQSASGQTTILTGLTPGLMGYHSRVFPTRHCWRSFASIRFFVAADAGIMR